MFVLGVNRREKFHLGFLIFNTAGRLSRRRMSYLMKIIRLQTDTGSNVTQSIAISKGCYQININIIYHNSMRNIDYFERFRKKALETKS